MMRQARTVFTEIFSHATAALAIVGVLASVSLLLVRLKIELPLPELVLSIVTVSITVLAGAFSMYLARAAKSLRLTPRVFLSYSRDNKEMARQVAQALRHAGVMVWFDEDQLKAGDELISTVRGAIKEANSFVFLLSHDLGPNTNLELNIAQANNIPVIVAAAKGVREYPEIRNAYRLRVDQEEPRSIDELVQAAVSPSRRVQEAAMPSAN